MTDHRLNALSPLDGRYADNCADLAAIFSEAGLIGWRIRVEAAWFRHLAESGRFKSLSALPAAAKSRVAALAQDPDPDAARRVKEIERQTRHDVKAVEQYLRERLAQSGAPAAAIELVHFGCTSEDINNLAWALMLVQAREQVLLPLIGETADALAIVAKRHAATAMLSRTHGQAATPTTLGKECANFVARLRRSVRGLDAVEALGKWNGAVGNFNAHQVACPGVD